MKTPITLVLALITFASTAQYNNTYDVNANFDKLTPAFVITNKKAESITVSYASDALTPGTNYFVLTKHDAYGSVIYNNRMDPFTGPTDGLTNVEALIQTDDEGVLVAGYHYDNSKLVEQPFLVKVDAAGNFQWARIYYVNKKRIFKSQTNKISLCRVFNDDKENYFIVGSGDSDINPGKDVATTVIKVDATGKMIFANKYYNVNTSQFTMVRDYPGDIDFSKPDKTFMITGYREDATLTSSSRVMYFFGIDNLGNVITKFLTLASKSIPMDQDMVYDPNKNVFATIFTHAKDGYVSGTTSIIGFVTINAAMAVANPKYLWHKEGSAHNGRSISLCKSGEYLLCSGIYDNGLTLEHNPAWLKVDNTGKPTSAFLRYNLKDDAYFGHHANSYNLVTGDEEYVLVNEQKTDLRVIRTDISGKACGVEKFEPYDKAYVPKIAAYEYSNKEGGEYKKYEVKEKLFFPDYRKCEGDGSNYRSTGIALLETNNGQMALYPTVLSAANANLIVENNSGSEVKMELRNMAGQLVFTNNEVAAGKTEVKLNPNGSLSTGIYLVQIYGAGGKLSATSKILITE